MGARKGKRKERKNIQSGIGRLPAQRLILRGLGFRRLQQTVVRPDTPQVRGLIRKVSHLVEIRDV